MEDFMKDAMEELSKALNIRVPKKKIPEEMGKTNVKVKDITLLNENAKIYIDFFYIDDEGEFHEAEVVIAADELESDIMEMYVQAFYIESKDITLRIDIIKYLDAVLNNPTIPNVQKCMLKAYREKVLKGEIF